MIEFTCTNEFTSMKTVIPYFLFFCLLCLNLGHAQQLTPPIQNFSSIHYKAASQNWGIDVDEEGILYAANNQGLLTFDGQRWELFPLKNNSIIRSVYAHNDRIYVGAYQEFGYWSRNTKGQMFYTSLMPVPGEYTFRSEEFWEILSYKDAIYFRSFGAIYKYEDDLIHPVRNVLTNKMLVYKDRLLIAVGHQGLHFLTQEGELEQLPGQEVLAGKTVVDVAIHGDDLLVATREALYVYSNGEYRLYPNTDLNEVLKAAEPNQLITVSNDQLIIGTVKNGIINLDTDGGQFQILNRKLGLQNNTVLAMTYRDGRLWLGLDNGIDAVALHSPVKFYTDESGELGSLYDIAPFEGDLYLASNTGVYKLSSAGDIKMIEGSEGHSWDLEVVNGRLINNHNTGTYQLESNRFVAVSDRTGSFQILPTGGKKHLLGTYSGIDVYNADDKTVKTLQGTMFPVKQMVMESPGRLWAAHAYEGLYRLELTPELDSAVSVKKIEPIRGEETYNARIFKINNQIAALLGENWYRYNIFKDQLEEFQEMERFRGYRLLYQDEGLFWFIHNRTNAILGTNFRDKEFVISSKMLNDRLVKGSERIIKAKDSLYYVTLHDGYARIDLAELMSWKQHEKLSVPTIRQLKDMEGNYDLMQPAQIPFKQARQVVFSVGLPFSDATALHYELVGSDTVKGEVQNGLLRFQNLDRGNYELKLTAVSPQNNVSDQATFNFSVLPPWYLSSPFRFLYLLLFLGLTACIFWVNKLKLKKHRLALEQKYEKEHEEQLNRLEKEKLRNEINLKRKELANTTMIAARKNEVLMEIQGELNKDKNKFSNEYRLKHIMTKLNKAIKDKDEWKVFETNFNELHEDFFKDVLAKYPKLTNKDLKLCSYLKMNLASKEIAPLMGISVRGVEVHRYRLRKKMGLDSNENLTNFLIANF